MHIMLRNIALCGPEERFNLLTEGIKRTSNVLARRHDRCCISCNERFSASRHGIAYSGPVRRHGKGQECRGGYRSRESILRVYVPRGKLWPTGSWVVARPSGIMRTDLDPGVEERRAVGLLHAATS